MPIGSARIARCVAQAAIVTCAARNALAFSPPKPVNPKTRETTRRLSETLDVPRGCHGRVIAGRAAQRQLER